MDLAAEVFGRLCHQEAGRAWVLGGQALSVCARCTGVYAGAALAALALPAARFTPSRSILWLHGAAMLQMALFGFHLLGPQPPWLRTLSGSLFAMGAVFFLFLPLRARLWERGRGRPWAYLCAAAAAQLLLQLLLRLDLPGMASAMDILSLAGLGFLALLGFAAIAAFFAIGGGRRKDT